MHWMDAYAYVDVFASRVQTGLARAALRRRTAAPLGTFGVLVGMLVRFCGFFLCYSIPIATRYFQCNQFERQSDL